MEPLVAEIERSFAELERQLGDPELIADQKRYADVARRHKQLSPARDMARRWRELTAQQAEADEMLSYWEDALARKEQALAHRGGTGDPSSRTTRVVVARSTADAIDKASSLFEAAKTGAVDAAPAVTHVLAELERLDEPPF